MKRTDYINWDEYFMGIALLTAMRSNQIGGKQYNDTKGFSMR